MLGKLRPILSNRWFVLLATDGVLLLATIFTHHSALDGAWRGDDLQQLFSARDYSFLQLLLDPHAWQTFTPFFFTPFLAAQFQLDIWLFGYDPHSFYLHHLLDLAALVILTYHFLIRRFPPLLSFLTCIGIISSMPGFGIAAYLYSRHYVAGLCFVIASVWLHQDAYRDNARYNLSASAIFFVLAISCREAYAMALLYFLLKSWRSPLFVRSLILYPALATIFAIWRWHMLGDFVGGYDFDGSIVDRIKALACVHRAIFGSDMAAEISLGLLAAGAIYFRLINPKHLIYLVALLLAAYVPLLFATTMIKIWAMSAFRYAFFPTWLLYSGITYVATLIWEKGNPKIASGLLGILIVTTSLSSAHQLPHFLDSLKEEDIQANFIRDGGPTSAMFLSDAIIGVNGNIHRQLAYLAGRKPSNVISSMDDVVPGITSYWQYDSHCHCMARLSQAQIRERLARIPHIGIDNAQISLLAIWQSFRGSVRLITAPEPLPCIVTFPGVFFECPDNMKLPGNFLLPIPTERMDLSRARLRRLRSDGLMTSTPFMQVPWTGTVQWERGVFLPTQSRSQRQSTECHLDAPSQKSIRINNSAPLELRGWIKLPSSSASAPDDVPFAVLDDTKGKYYAANLYRESRQGQEKSGDLPTMIGGHVLDADMSKVESGTYRLLLGTGDSLCDTGTTLAIESP